MGLRPLKFTPVRVEAETPERQAQVADSRRGKVIKKVHMTPAQQKRQDLQVEWLKAAVEGQDRMPTEILNMESLRWKKVRTGDD